ncbi:MAG: hypothetical protein J3R72DRAFT_434567 [Linnemannia gamsii]|nr:MAG: hypothetical protein J3R72DRAFT_434567 [Linnemannia gamsii]
MCATRLCLKSRGKYWTLPCPFFIFFPQLSLSFAWYIPYVMLLFSSLFLFVVVVSLVYFVPVSLLSLLFFVAFRISRSPFAQCNNNNKRRVR